MMTITPGAADQIRLAAKQGKMEGMPLRVAAKRAEGGAIEYMMGFDEIGEDDIELTLEGVPVLISEFSSNLLKDTTLDFVEISPGEFQFIFIPPGPEASKRDRGLSSDLS